MGSRYVRVVERSPWGPPTTVPHLRTADLGSLSPSLPALPLLPAPIRHRPARIVTRAGSLDAVVVQPTGRLLPSRWLAIAVIVAQIAVVPALLVSTSAGAAAGGVAVVLMMLWSGVAARNVVSARPVTVYSRPPRPLWAALSWLAPTAVVIAALAATGVVQRSGFATDLAADERLLRIRLLVVLGAVVPLLVAWWLPHAVLARATSWVGGARRRWQRRCWAPMLAAAAGAAGVLAVELAAEMDGSTTSPLASDTAASVASVGLVALPLLVAAWTSWSAMRETERASRMTWERYRFPEGSLDITDEMAARAAAAAYLASHPDG